MNNLLGGILIKMFGLCMVSFLAACMTSPPARLAEIVESNGAAGSYKLGRVETVEQIVVERPYWSPDYGQAMVGVVGYAIMQRLFYSDTLYDHVVRLENGGRVTQRSKYSFNIGACVGIDESKGAETVLVTSIRCAVAEANVARE